MKLKFKEDPKEWRKSTWLTALGLALLGSVLWWRRVLPSVAWVVWLVVLTTVAVLAWVRPGWFRGYYRVSLRAGFALSQLLANIVLALLFFLVITPLGWLLRLFGQDPLRLKRAAAATSYWIAAKPSGPLDRLF